MVEQAIQMALQPSPTYHRMQLAFSLYEAGKLKGQRPRELKGLSLQKALEGRYAPKLPQFKIFQGLKVRSWVYTCINVKLMFINRTKKRAGCWEDLLMVLSPLLRLRKKAMTSSLPKLSNRPLLRRSDAPGRSLLRKSHSTLTSPPLKSTRWHEEKSFLQTSR